MLDYADKLTREPWNMTEADLAPLREAGLNDRGILDLNQVVAYFAYVNRVADGLGVAVDDYAQEANSEAAVMSDEAALHDLYHTWLQAWNDRDAEAMAALCAEEAEVIGFDGSQMAGRGEVASTLAGIFAHHATGRYAGIVRSASLLGPDIALVRGVVGMIPAGMTELNPKLNTIQTLVASKREGRWRILLFQNTPAQFHGRPDLVEQLTEELRPLF